MIRATLLVWLLVLTRIKMVVVFLFSVRGIVVSRSFSSLQRQDIVRDMINVQNDLLIIGGGITGAGIALDAVTRGMKTVLLEMQDFAAGTSSRSTKLVHGGLRYLKQFEVGMVAEVGKERAVVYENGPHVTTPKWMLLPIYQGGTFGKLSTSIGLKIYDFLAAVKQSERRRMLNRRDTIRREPLLKQEGLLGSGYYVEYRTDDARLTIEVMKEAVHRGVKALNYSKVEGLIYQDGKVVGVRVVDQYGGQKYNVFAKKIINATGPWVDTLREKDKSKRGKSLQLTKGVHLVIDQKHFPLKQAVYFDTPDGRMVFAIPRDGKTYVGTTDTVYKDNLEHPRMTTADRKYVIDAINFMFPSLKITKQEIESSCAGIRPLIHEEGKGPSEISRKDEIWQSESGLITIAGGKLTGYRKMSEMVVDLVVDMMEKEQGVSFGACQTRNMPISGGAVGGSAGFLCFVKDKIAEGIAKGLSEEQAKRLVHRFGSNVDRLYEITVQQRSEAKNAGLPLDWFAVLFYSLHEEMAVKPVDFFIRRTGALFFDIDSVYQFKSSVIDYMAKELKWSKEQKSQYTAEIEQHLYDAVIPIDEE